VKHLTIALAIAASASLATPAGQGQPSVPDVPFDGNVEFLKPPPDVYFGEVAGVAVNSKGHVFVFSRGGTVGPAFGAAAAQLFEFDRTGTFVREIGKGMYAMSYAHSVKIDRDDNIWLVDKGSDMIVKLTPAGRVAMVFGRKKEASDETAVPWTRPTPPRAPVDGQFRQPTDVTWDPQGNIFISDGYINSRVAKFSRDGDWVKSWGEKGTKDGEFDTPHSIASDAAGSIYVADRGNRRIQVFDADGKHLRSMSVDVAAPPDAKPAIGNRPAPDVTGTQAPGAPWAICITPGPNQVLFMSDAYPGRIYKMTLDGKVLGVLGKSGKQPKQFGWIHQIACPSASELYVAELLTWRVQKLTLK